MRTLNLSVYLVLYSPKAGYENHVHKNHWAYKNVRIELNKMLSEAWKLERSQCDTSYALRVGLRLAENKSNHLVAYVKRAGSV
jgi:hypothetical protein